MNASQTTSAVLVAVLAVLLAPSARAVSDDCLFDGACAARPALSASVEDAPVLAEADSPARAGTSRLSGFQKGASEGALFGFYAGIQPAVALMSEGFGRRLSRGADGPRSDNSHGDAYYYGGIALAVLLYVPALVLGGVGGLLGGAAGAAAPESSRRWDAERWWGER